MNEENNENIEVNEKEKINFNDENKIVLKKSTYSRIIIGLIVVIAVSTFFGGYFFPESPVFSVPVKFFAEQYRHDILVFTAGRYTVVFRGAQFPAIEINHPDRQQAVKSSKLFFRNPRFHGYIQMAFMATRIASRRFLGSSASPT